MIEILTFLSSLVEEVQNGGFADILIISLGSALAAILSTAVLFVLSHLVGLLLAWLEDEQMHQSPLIVLIAKLRGYKSSGYHHSLFIKELKSKGHLLLNAEDVVINTCLHTPIVTVAVVIGIATPTLAGLCAIAVATLFLTRGLKRLKKKLTKHVKDDHGNQI